LINAVSPLDIEAESVFAFYSEVFSDLVLSCLFAEEKRSGDKEKDNQKDPDPEERVEVCYINANGIHLAGAS